MKFFHALIILATSGGVATAKDSSRASASDLNRKQERDRKRFLRIKQAESGRRRTQYVTPFACLEGIPIGAETCCINNVRPLDLDSKGRKPVFVGIVVPLGDEATVGCAEVCRPICAEENGEGPPDGAINYPPDTCIDPQGPPATVVEFLAQKDSCPLN